MLTLVMNPGLPEQQTFQLSPGTVTIGRTKDNAVVCLHKSLSRTHAQLEYDGTSVQLTDLQSKNGVFVNGRRIARAEIGVGDVFRCGDVNFVLESPALKRHRPTTRSSLGAQMNNTLPSPFAVDPVKTRPSTPPAAPASDDSRSRERLFLLMRVSELCVSDLGVDKMLEEIVGLAAQAFDLDRLSVLMIDEKTFALKVRVAKSFAPVTKTPYSQRVVDWVLDHESPASVDDVSRDRSLPGDLARDADIRSAMCVPIAPGGGQLVGVLYADSLTQKGCFHADDLALLRALGNLVAVALEAHQHRASERPTLARR